jgi:hypothetical protein
MLAKMNNPNQLHHELDEEDNTMTYEGLKDERLDPTIEALQQNHLPSNKYRQRRGLSLELPMWVVTKNWCMLYFVWNSWKRFN